MAEPHDRTPASGEPIGRREHRITLRFEARGRLSGHLIGSIQPVFVLNLGLGGFGAEVPGPVAPGPHIVRLTTPDHTATLLEAWRVYCRPTPRQDGSRRYTAGFEFIRPPQNVDLAIKAILEQVTELRLGGG